MASVVQIASPDAIRRIHRVQTVTIAWMTVEAAVSLFASWRALAAYKDFLTLWKNADPDIPILKEAKVEYAKLQ